MAEVREDGPPKKSREDYRKQKELDEARKSGLEPAEQDEFGVWVVILLGSSNYLTSLSTHTSPILYIIIVSIFSDINPHIPQYIKDAPWYLQMHGPTLTHQRVQPETVKSFDGVAKIYQKGLTNVRLAAIILCVFYMCKSLVDPLMSLALSPLSAICSYFYLLLRWYIFYSKIEISSYCGSCIKLFPCRK